MFDIIAAALLIAFGIIITYFAVEERVRDNKLLFIILIGIACIIAGAWIILTKVTLWLIIRRIAGIFLGFFGLFLIIGFPTIKDYQPEQFTKAGIFIGIAFLIIGTYLMFF